VIGGSEPEERETGNADGGFSRNEMRRTKTAIAYWALGRELVAGA
jgi:hypothetical protein